MIDLEVFVTHWGSCSSNVGRESQSRKGWLEEWLDISVPAKGRAIHMKNPEFNENGDEKIIYQGMFLVNQQEFDVRCLFLVPVVR